MCQSNNYNNNDNNSFQNYFFLSCLPVKLFISNLILQSSRVKYAVLMPFISHLFKRKKILSASLLSYKKFHPAHPGLTLMMLENLSDNFQFPVAPALSQQPLSTPILTTTPILT